MTKACFSEQELGGLRLFMLPVLDDNYTYLLADGKLAVCIDPAEAGPVLSLVDEYGLSLNMALVTHYHGDHTGGVSELKNKTGCLVAGPRTNGCSWVDRHVVDGQSLEFGQASIKAIATPGHTPEHLCYLEETKGALFSGDALFGGGCGRVFSGQYGPMWKSLCRLAELPDRVLLFGGHEYTMENLQFAREVEPGNHELQSRFVQVSDRLNKKLPPLPSTLGLEKATNPFLRTHSPEIRARLKMKESSDLEVFTELRRRKDRYG